MNKLNKQQVIELLQDGATLHNVFRAVYPYWYLQTSEGEEIHNIRKGAPTAALKSLKRYQYIRTNDSLMYYINNY